MVRIADLNPDGKIMMKICTHCKGEYREGSYLTHIRSIKHRKEAKKTKLEST